MISAVLDTCVLYPALQRDLLLSLARNDAFLPLWSPGILAELEHHEHRKLAKLGLSHAQSRARAKNLINKMNAAFPAATVPIHADQERVPGLPDPDDEHVVHAALAARADVLVTDNLKDFPPAFLPARLAVRSARDFITDVVAEDVRRACLSLAQIEARLRDPPVTSDVLLSLLERRYGLSRAAQLMRDHNSGHRL